MTHGRPGALAARPMAIRRLRKVGVPRGHSLRQEFHGHESATHVEVIESCRPFRATSTLLPDEDRVWRRVAFALGVLPSRPAS